VKEKRKSEMRDIRKKRQRKSEIRIKHKQEEKEGREEKR